jgi:hypothetical protein
MSTHPVEILISSILIKPEYYPRFQTDPERIKEFVENMECGETFPPIKVTKDETTGLYVLLDGKHRIEAYKLRGLDKILAFIFPVKKEHWLMTAARFNSKSSKPLLPEEIKQIIIQSWENGIKDTDEIAREMGRTVRYIEMILKPTRDEERNKREEKIVKMRQQGMSQRQIASKIGLSLGYINKALTLNEDSELDGHKQSNNCFGSFSDGPYKTNPVPMEKNNFVSVSSESSPVIPIKDNSNPLVFTKRNDFVLRTPKNINIINVLDFQSEKLEVDAIDPKPNSRLPMESNTEKNQNEFLSEVSNEFHEESLDDTCHETTQRDLSNGFNDQICQKSEGVISDTFDSGNMFPKRSHRILQSSNEKDKANVSNPSFELSEVLNQKHLPDNQELSNLHSIKPNHDKHKLFTKNSSPYPSYLDQIDLYREFPLQWQQAIRAMELVKIYKLDIVDITDEINEPILWVRKVLVAAIALSLLNSDDLNDASSVEVLLGLDIEIIKCIQNILYFKEMVCPIAPDMESWFKENLSANDLDMIVELSGVSRENLSYLLKGQTPPPKVQCFKEFPGSYKKQISAFIQVLCEIHEHAKNKMFNHNSARDLLFHLNRNQTAINEIIDVLRQNVLM